MKNVAVITIVILFFLSGNLYASPWMRSEGRGLVSSSVSYSTDSQLWTEGGFLVPLSEDRLQVVYSLSYEYGYSYDYNLFAGTAFTYRDTGTRVIQGVSSIRIGARGRLQRFRNGRPWQVTALLPARRVNNNPDDPEGGGSYGLHAGLFYRLLPDPYEHPFSKFPLGVWGGGIGIATLQSGNAANQVDAYWKWEKRFHRTPFGISFRGTGISSFAEGPLLPYARFQSEGGLSYDLSRMDGVSISYSVDVLGRNITQGSAFQVRFSHAFE